MSESTSSGAGTTIVPSPHRRLIVPVTFPTLGNPLLSANFSRQVFLGMAISVLEEVQLSDLRLGGNRTKASKVSDYLDLDIGPFGERCHLNGGTCWEIPSKILCVHFVHAGEVGQISEENRALNHVFEGQFLVVEDRFYILKYPFGLRFYVPFDEVTRGRVERDLSGAKEQIIDAHGVVVGPHCGRRFGWFNDLFGKHKSQVI
jgi:hypothetical protein